MVGSGIDSVEAAIDSCRKIGQWLQKENGLAENVFTTYLNHVKAANGKDLKEFYKEMQGNPSIVDLSEYLSQFPENITVKILGGGVNPIYQVTYVDDQGNKIDAALKLDSHNTNEYNSAKEILSSNESIAQAVLGANPTPIYRDTHRETNYEVWPLHPNNLETKMRVPKTDQERKEVCQDSINTLAQTFEQLARLAALDPPLFMSDLKPGNIFFDNNGEVKFSDLKGLTNVEFLNNTRDADISPGYIANEMYTRENPIDIKELNVYQLLVTMDCFIRGKSIDQRLMAESSDEDKLTMKGGKIFLADGVTPYTPDLSIVDTSTPEGTVLQIVFSHMESLKEGSDIHFQDLANLASNLNVMKDKHPGLLNFIRQNMEADPKLGKVLLNSIMNGATSPREMSAIISKQMSHQKRNPIFSFFVGQKDKYFELKSMHDNLQDFIQSNLVEEEKILQEKFDKIFSSLQQFRDIENQLLGVDSKKLTEQEKSSLFAALDEIFPQIIDARDAFLAELEKADPESQEAFMLAYKKALPEAYIDGSITTRYQLLDRVRPEKSLEETEQSTSEISRKLVGGDSQEAKSSITTGLEEDKENIQKRSLEEPSDPTTTKKARTAAAEPMSQPAPEEPAPEEPRSSFGRR